MRGLSERELDYLPRDGGWSPREVVHHTADSELTSAILLRTLLAEDNPVIEGVIVATDRTRARRTSRMEVRL